MNAKVEARLTELGLTLPEPARPVANYTPFCLYQNHLFISGQLPFRPDGHPIRGRLGDGASVAQGQEAAQLAALHVLAQAREALGDLGRIERCLRLTGFVSAAPDFTEHPAVVNGASNLLVDALGERGKHTRVAVGVSGLPLGAMVEIDAIFAVA